MLKSLSIRLKLTLLAGVPVLGALALASLLWGQAQKSAESAAALGSVEDLASLSTGISKLVHELQAERALAGVVLGHLDLAGQMADLDPDVALQSTKAADTAQKRLEPQFTRSDTARANLETFLHGRDLSALPARLQRDLKLAHTQLNDLTRFRKESASVDQPILPAIEFIASTNRALIDATASLTALSDDGEMLRNISALVSVMQVKERASQEHALLSAVFAANRYPPGTYRSFVKLTTQEQDYIDVLRSNANENQIKSYEKISLSPDVAAALKMGDLAKNTIDEDFGIEVNTWFKAQSAKVSELRNLETRLTGEVRAAAMSKVSETENSIRTSLGLSAAVLLFSTFLGWLIARGVDRSVRSLSSATEEVQKNKDFTIRAKKVSNDELGILADGFNAMLSDIQVRDGELEEYRQNLEVKVEERTRALQTRNEAMRMVLDNVEQGLATIDSDGIIESERSAAFDTWFGPPANDTLFGHHLCGPDKDSAALLELGWDEVIEGFLPTALSIHQMPSILESKGKHYTLSYKPIQESEEINAQVTGALLVVTDVTDEVARRAEEVRQREFISVFEHLMKNKNGFIEFFNETERLVLAVLARETDKKLMLRDIHTVKGNCGIFGVSSVASACHNLETELAEEASYPTEKQVEVIRTVWETFALRVRTMVGDDKEDVVEVAHKDLQAVISAVRRRVPHGELATQLERLKYEPIESRFQRIGEQAKALAERLGKPEPNLQIEANDLRFPLERWGGFWAAFTHVLRNAVDHGMETLEERRECRKEGNGMLRLAAKRHPGGYVVELEDDGHGINWDGVRRKAKSAGLPHTTHDDLVAALFSDGVSTREAVTDTSGRGVGMSAVMQATLDMKGSIEVKSTRGVGTLFRFKFPVAVGDLIGVRSRAPGSRPSLTPVPESRSLPKPA